MINTGTDVNLQKGVSCRVTNSILRYLESQGYDVDSITADLPYSKGYLTDPLNRVTYETREVICRRAAQLTNDDTIMYQVGLSTPKLNPLGGIESMVRMLAGPKTEYRFIAKYATLLDRIFNFRTTFNGNNRATITMCMSGDYLPSKDSCYFAQGILAAIPTLWGLPPAEVREKKCMCKPDKVSFKDDVEYESKACVFEVNWQPLQSWYKRLRDNLLFRGTTYSVKHLEYNFQLLDQKNAELVARNKQLAAVREIAISVDKVRTVDEALSLAVEQSREIDGVRFVIVQKLDESGEFVTTPYYSKFRNKYVLGAINALGFDPEKELGKNPTSKQLRFRLSKLKVAQDYYRNPRVMIFTSLAELLDGVWPRPLCDSIQKILRVKKLVIVPLMVEGKSWGNMLYFLTKEMPTDILEMIGAHCAIAIKNIGYIETLANEATQRRILIEQSRDGIVILDQNGKVYEANRQFAEMLGYSQEEISQLYVYDWEYQYPHERVLEMIRTVDEAGDHFETRHRRKDGSIYDVEISTNGAIFAGQKLIFCVCRDITERKKLEEALIESEEKFSVAFRSSPNAIFIVTIKEGKFIEANESFTHFTGYTREEVLGHDSVELGFWESEDEMNRMAKNLQEKGRIYNEEYASRMKTGEIRVGLFSAETIDIGGEACLIMVITDITDRRHAEKALKESEEHIRSQKGLIERVLATIPNAVFLLDKDLRIIVANQAVYNIFKLNEQEHRNNLIAKIFEVSDLNQTIAKMKSRGENSVRTEFRHVVAGHERILCADVFAMPKDELLLVINDITDEREKQERLYLTDRLASVGEMASGVAHELNNPLTSIIGLSNLLIKQGMSDDIKEDVTAINSEAQRCAAIVKNLLTFARKHAPKRQPLNIANVVEDVMRLRAYEHKANNISIETKFSPDLPEVLADYFQLQQVFLNIILNAETAMIDAHGCGTLKITGKSANSHISISFSDDGPGISDENMRLIFNPFFTTKEVGKGTGLGLSICYGIVTAHGGKVYARSEHGKGTTFVVELPVLRH